MRTAGIIVLVYGILGFIIGIINTIRGHGPDFTGLVFVAIGGLLILFRLSEEKRIGKGNTIEKRGYKHGK
ncbi:MAG: hypothetical protein HPY80_08520 [Bacteroidales bacterium]|nr:hypothetical protein [Bacteroidales bacterium]